MSTRPKDVDATLLQLEIVRRIPKLPNKIDAQSLHQQLLDAGFDRDIRTVQRMLKILCEHFDIECDERSKPFGYSWKLHSKGLALPILNEQQSLLLKLAEQQLKYLLPANLMASMKPFFEQAGKSHEATSMPLAIAQQGTSIYLVCRYEGFTDNRLLALHRIRKAEISTLSFERPKDFNLQAYQDDGHLGFGNGDKIRLSFSITRSAGFHLTETPLSKDQKILEESDQHYRFQVTVANNDMLEWWLRKFGEDIWNIEKESL